MGGITPDRWIGAHPGNFTRGRAGHRPEAIVIHIMDGTLVGTDSWFRDPAAHVSAHYGIGRGGELHAYVAETDAAHHAGVVDRSRWSGLRRGARGIINPNYYTIGIEHEGRGAALGAWPAAMMEKSIALAADIVRRWQIPADRDHIIPHCDIRASKPHCPGAGIGLDRYIEKVRVRLEEAGAEPPARDLTLAVRVLRTANIRTRPTTASLARRQAVAGDVFTATAIVTGEAIGGNGFWLRNSDGEYLWAGTTDHPHPSSGHIA